MSYIYDQGRLDGIITKILNTPEEDLFPGVSIDDACQALAAETAPKDVEIAESKPRSKWLALADSICHEPWRRNVKP